MTKLNTKIPDALFRQAQTIANREQISLDQFIAIALASQVSVWETRQNFAERAQNGDWQKAQEILAKAPDIEPENYDTLAQGEFAGDLAWHIKNVVIGATRNWSKVVSEWNLANDAGFKPHTLGGCDVCQGALTIANNTVTRNVSYYIIAHISKFVSPGSVRVASNIAGNLPNVAFKTPTGKRVLIVENGGNQTADFNLKFKNKSAVISLSAGSVGTYIW